MLDWPLFQLACLLVLAFAYTALIRAERAPEGRRRLLVSIALIFVGSWLAENTSIRRYGFYAYPDTWWLKLDEMPLLVSAIWPIVVLTARQVITALFPGLVGLRRAAAVAAIVFIDASLVEAVAVATPLWAWREGGYLGVPLIGLIGWSAFAFSITLMIEQYEKQDNPRILQTLARPFLALGLTHLLLVVTWWVCFRHVLRGPLPETVVWYVLGLSLVGSLLLRRRPNRIAADIALPRIAATSVFFVLLALFGDGPALTLHFAAVALPYLALLDWRGFARLMKRTPPSIRTAAR
jgi:hypothetical protein